MGAVGLKLIVAMDPSGVIGRDGDMPWHYPEDFKRFKRRTMGGVLIMGRKTYESLPKKTLPGREIVVVTRQPDYKAPHVAGGLLRAIQVASRANYDTFGGVGTLWIAGGENVYTQALGASLVEEVDLTIVPAVEEEPSEGASVLSYFPKALVDEKFEVIEDGPNPADPRLRHMIYRRKPEE